MLYGYRLMRTLRNSGKWRAAYRKKWSLFLSHDNCYFFLKKETVLFYFIYLLYLSAVGLVVGWWQNKYDAGDDPDPIHVISPVDKKRKL